MDRVEQQEREKYAEVWTWPWYHLKSHGVSLWENHQILFPPNIRHAVDFGCGPGKLMSRLGREGIPCWGVDIVDVLDAGVDRSRLCIATLWGELEFEDAPETFDLGVCTDVMEHIPEHLVDQSLINIGNLCEVVVFKIANFPSEHEGLTLHLTLRPAPWWSERMEALGGQYETYEHRPKAQDFVILWWPNGKQGGCC